MFGTKTSKAINTTGYHVSKQMNIDELEGYLNALPVSAQIIEICHCGSAGQRVYVVYRI